MKTRGCGVQECLCFAVVVFFSTLSCRLEVLLEMKCLILRSSTSFADLHVVLFRRRTWCSGDHVLERSRGCIYGVLPKTSCSVANRSRDAVTVEHGKRETGNLQGTCSVSSLVPRSTQLLFSLTHTHPLQMHYLTFLLCNQESRNQIRIHASFMKLIVIY